MKKDFITINSQQYRVEINMSTAEEWERRSGKKLGQFEIEAASSAKNGGVATRAMLIWLYCAIIEGEELEGRAFELDFIEFKRMLRPGTMSIFAPIFIKQYIGTLDSTIQPDDDNNQKKKNTIRSRFASFAKSQWVKLGGVAAILILAILLYYGIRYAV